LITTKFDVIFLSALLAFTCSCKDNTITANSHTNNITSSTDKQVPNTVSQDDFRDIDPQSPFYNIAYDLDAFLREANKAVSKDADFQFRDIEEKSSEEMVGIKKTKLFQISQYLVTHVDGIQISDNVSDERLGQLRGHFADEFMVITQKGQVVFLNLSKLSDPGFAGAFRDFYNTAQVLQKLGCAEDGMMIPRRNPENFHIGKTSAESLIEEILLDSAAEKLPNHLKKYAGYPMSKIYSVDKTYQKSVLLGYLIDVNVFPKKDDKGVIVETLTKKWAPIGKNKVFYINTSPARMQIAMTVEDFLRNSKEGYYYLPDQRKSFIEFTYVDRLLEKDNFNTDAPIHSFLYPIFIKGVNSK
jgi:hypothetical protein